MSFILFILAAMVLLGSLFAGVFKQVVTLFLGIAFIISVFGGAGIAIGHQIVAMLPF
jgi:hypothetical protein